MAEGYVTLEEGREKAQEISDSYHGDPRFKKRIWFLNPIKRSIDVIVFIKPDVDLDALLEESKDKPFFNTIGSLQYDDDKFPKYVQYRIPIKPDDLTYVKLGGR